MRRVVIVPWQDAFHQDYIRLSVAWLEKYVRVEAADEALLYHPHEAALEKGGMIFFARDGARNVGTVTMLRTDAETFELAKLAVTEAYQRRHIGDRLVETGLAYAVAHGAKRVVLFTNSRLYPALWLYRKHGFVQTPLVDNAYEESDMRMEWTPRA